MLITFNPNDNTNTVKHWSKKLHLEILKDGDHFLGICAEHPGITLSAKSKDELIKQFKEAYKLYEEVTLKFKTKDVDKTIRYEIVYM